MAEQLQLEVRPRRPRVTGKCRTCRAPYDSQSPYTPQVHARCARRKDSQEVAIDVDVVKGRCVNCGQSYDSSDADSRLLHTGCEESNRFRDAVFAAQRLEQLVRW